MNHFYKRSYSLADGVGLELGERTLMMGILNVTPDSFSDGGQHNSVDKALDHAAQLIDEGADIIDIGGESTRPGFTPITVEQELERILPVINAIKREFPHIPLSIDTYKSATAAKALEAGAHIINDIWSLQYDGQMAQVAATHHCPVIISHNRRSEQPYTDVVQDVIDDLQRSVEHALAAGVKHENIWLDPGIGFAKNYEQNLLVHAHLDRIHCLGFPVLLGTSRKRFIRDTLQVEAAEAGEGTLASNIVGIAQGCQILRVHDVKAMKKAATLADAILYRRSNEKEPAHG